MTVLQDWSDNIALSNGNVDTTNLIRITGVNTSLSFSTKEFVDGSEITLTTTGSEGWDFGSNNLNYATLGFGQGFLESASLDDPLEHTLDPITGKQVEYENSVANSRTPTRFIKQLDGIRALHTASVTGDHAGGFISFDGGVFPDDTPIFFSSWVKMAAGSINILDSTGSQWKTYRVNQEKYFNTTVHGEDNNPNSIYHKVFATEEERDKLIDGEVTHKRTNSDYTEYQHVHATFDNKWTRQDLALASGDVDVANGSIHSRVIKPVDGDGIREVSRIPTLPLLDALSQNRWRWLQLQDYYKHAENVDLYRTDLFFQVGTLARFELANGATPTTTTDSKILLPKTWTTGEVKLHLYKQMLTGYTGKYIHFYNHEGVFVKGVQI